MEKQRRYSQKREAILNDLKSRCDHPSADSVYASLRSTNPNISLGTVYRNLRELSESGLITCFSCDGKERFDGNIASHHHLVCQICGEISDVFDDTVDQIAEKTRRDTDFNPKSITLVIRGICHNCKNKITQNYFTED